MEETPAADAASTEQATAAAAEETPADTTAPAPAEEAAGQGKSDGAAAIAEQPAAEQGPPSEGGDATEGVPQDSMEGGEAEGEPDLMPEDTYQEGEEEEEEEADAEEPEKGKVQETLEDLEKEIGITESGFSVDSEASKTKAALGSVISLRKAGVEGGYYDRKVARYANTYKLNADNPFHVEKVEKLLNEVLMEAMENLQYDPDLCPKQAKWACSMIRAKVKEMEFDRYKILTVVSIGEKRAQDILYTIRFLWDEERDKLALATHENMYIFGVALCIGVYYE